LNVTKATWIPLKVILPKQATPYQFVGSGGVDLSSYTGKINIAFRYTGSGKTLLWMELSGRRCAGLEVSF
jgi:hypothetical protein